MRNEARFFPEEHHQLYMYWVSLGKCSCYRLQHPQKDPSINSQTFREYKKVAECPETIVQLLHVYKEG